MSTSRPRRTSTLGNRSPAKPQTPSEPAVETGRPLGTPEPATGSLGPAVAQQAAEKAHGERIYIRPSEKARAEAAMYATLRHTGMKASFSAFAVEAINRLARELEAEHNEGKPF